MLIESFLEVVGRSPNKLAVEDPLRHFTYGQLETLSRVIRRELMSATECERVGVMLPASCGGTATLLGVQWAGRTAVPLNFLLPPRELGAIIADAGIDLVISTEHFREQMDALPVKVLYLEHLKKIRLYMREKLTRHPDPPAVAPDDVAVILYTSGTTGEPKGVCLTHENFRSNCRAAIEHLRVTPDDHLLGVVPPFHVFGLNVVHFLPIMLGATVTYIPRFSPQATHQTLSKGQVTIFLAVPSMYAAMARLKEIQPEHFRSIRLAASGGEPLPRTIYETVRERMGLQLVEGYGLTETAPIISADLPWAHKVGTVGPPLPGVEIQPRDESGRPVGANQEGELYVRGPLVMKGYYQRPAETAAVIDSEGWFRTGDIVRVDADGYISITGRAKDIVIVAGENVYPREVENVLDQHPAVVQSAVIGQQDSSRGEVVVAFVTLSEGAGIRPDDLRAYCREHLAGYKVPREIHIRQDLPRGPTGKILKRDLRKELSEA
jgi:long-chain acyl-CoA synthetase